VKLDVAEGLSGAADGQLIFGGAVGVVECRFRGAAFAIAAQVLDGQRSVQSALACG